ncbi:MAG: VanZ family protein [Bacilli bacterium]|nr:VanZ family protein [Bacilli bacterium]
MKGKINIIKNITLIVSLLIYSYLIFVGRNQYIFDMSYTKCILFLLLICLLLYTYGMIDNEDKTYKKNINLYILLYFILLISITFFIGRTNIKFYDWWYRGQYEAFYTITSQLKFGSKLSILKNVIGNSVMLIPLSFLLMIKNNKYKNLFRQLVIILPIIVSIELLQAFTHTGAFDIDDILLNYLGTIIFTFIITRFSIIDKIKKIFYTDYKINENIKNGIFYVVLVLLVFYVIILVF